MKNLIKKIQITNVMYFLLVLLSIFISAKFGQHLFFDWKTSPAIIWPPTGIAVAAIWLGGYRYILPVFLGFLLASLSGPYGHIFPAAVTTPMGQVMGHVLGVYLLRKFDFDGTFSTIKNVVTFLIIIVVLCAVAPTLTTLISILTGNLSTTPLVSFTRSWAGYIFSCLIITPFILLWAKTVPPLRFNAKFEIIAQFALLTVSGYLLFWDDVLPQFSFIYFALFFISHLWICLRFSSRLVALSVMVTSIIGILGVFLSTNPDRMLNAQLFSVELFLFLIVSIFYLFSALVKERSRNIDSLKVMMDEIEKENILKNEFLAVLAHELRNPLAPIKTTFEILELKELDEDSAQLVKNAHQQVYSMRRLLDDLLDITRVTQGKFQLKISPVHFCSIINQSILSTQELFKNRNHTLIRDQVCNDLLWINVDPVRLEQVIVNVLNNAAKYTPTGGTIKIAHTVDGGNLIVKITDSGMGIEKEHLEDIFKSFWQMNIAKPHGTGGIGVGLALTKNIVELHGGTIHAESEGKNKGTTFVITLPGITSTPPPMYNLNLSLDKLSIPKLSILVADDNVIAADSLSQLLTLKGHSVTTTYTGQGVLEAVEQAPPDLILLDIELPDVSGYVVASKLREVGYDKKIIALSGYGQKQDKVKAFESGFDFHFTKPMSIKSFEEYLLKKLSEA